MAPKCFKMIKNGQSRDVLELSFHGDLRFVSLNAILEIFRAETKTKTVSKTTHEPEVFRTLNFCVYIKTH